MHSSFTQEWAGKRPAQGGFMKTTDARIGARVLVGFFAAIFLFLGASSFASVPARPDSLVGDDALVLTGVWGDVGGK